MIELLDVCAGYKRKIVVDHASFLLGKGAYGLLGPNGAGKTTLLRAIAGVLPYQGSISCSGSIGYLPQHFGIYRELSVTEAMRYFAIIKKIPNDTQKKKIEMCIEETNLTEYRNKRVRELSGGMLRRLGIAQALLGDPDLLLVDEPTAGLDPEERVRFKEILQGLKTERTVLLSTHIVEDVSEICESVMIMNKGRIIKNESETSLLSALSGKVFRLSGEPDPMDKTMYFLKTEYVNRQKFYRVVSEIPQEAETLQPTLEDAYLVSIHDDSLSGK